MHENKNESGYVKESKIVLKYPIIHSAIQKCVWNMSDISKCRLYCMHNVMKVENTESFAGSYPYYFNINLWIAIVRLIVSLLYLVMISLPCMWYYGVVCKLAGLSSSI
jgi:hypothetical protein